MHRSETAAARRLKLCFCSSAFPHAPLQIRWRTHTSGGSSGRFCCFGHVVSLPPSHQPLEVFQVRPIPYTPPGKTQETPRDPPGGAGICCRSEGDVACHQNPVGKWTILHLADLIIIILYKINNILYSLLKNSPEPEWMLETQSCSRWSRVWGFHWDKEETR